MCILRDTFADKEAILFPIVIYSFLLDFTKSTLLSVVRASEPRISH